MSDSRKLSQIVATGVGLIGVGALLYLGYRKFNPSKTVELLKEPLKGRSLHWVQRCTDLKPTVKFFKQIFGMKVLRHEENKEPCGITCNGRYNGAWSKTMTGFDLENVAYSLEVTYNYGVYNYEEGNGLQTFGINSPVPEMSLKRAKQLGYEVNDNIIKGPDGYQYAIVKKTNNHEPFKFVSIKVADLEKSLQFYTGILGMKDFTDSFDLSIVPEAKNGGKNCKVVSYSEDQVALILVHTHEYLNLTSWEGRHAIALPEKDIKTVYELVEKFDEHQIVHEMQELDEQLGVLFIAIVADPDGYELCLVSEETFNKAAVDATDYEESLDWENRRKWIDERAGKKKERFEFLM